MSRRPKEEVIAFIRSSSLSNERKEYLYSYIRSVVGDVSEEMFGRVCSAIEVYPETVSRKIIGRANFAGVDWTCEERMDFPYNPREHLFSASTDILIQPYSYEGWAIYISRRGMPEEEVFSLFPKGPVPASYKIGDPLTSSVYILPMKSNLTFPYLGKSFLDELYFRELYSALRCFHIVKEMKSNVIEEVFAPSISMVPFGFRYGEFSNRPFEKLMP